MDREESSMQRTGSVDPEEQKAQVREFLQRDAQITVGQNWYLLSIDWWKKWRAYVRFDAASSRVHEPEEPGEIQNRDLLEATGRLKAGLSENVFFVFVPESVWERLKLWYGCEEGSEIARKVIKVGTRTFIEVYPWTINLSYKDGGILSTLAVTISQGAKIEELEALAKQRFGFEDDDDITLWDSYQGTRSSVLQGDKWVGQSVLYQNTTVIVQRGQGNMLQRRDADSDIEAKSTSGHDADVGDASSDDEFGSPPHYRMASPSGYTTATATATSSSNHYSSSSRHGVRGTVGLGNLGNTCFMNSSLQCLSNTLPLRNYFLSGEFYWEINAGNVLGTKGELVQAFANLLRNMWDGSAGQVAPRVFKHTLGKHAEQFMGYDQHDSQELIAYLLDGIHEDVNKIEKKPFVEQVEAKDGESDESAADRAWEGHLQRNRSRIVDLFQGQFKSVVTCPVEDCNRVSITFDPFMYLSVPLPFSQERKVTLTYVKMGGDAPKQMAVQVAKAASLKTALKAMYTKLNAEVGSDGLPPGVDLKVADTYQGDIYEMYDLTTNLTDVPDNVDLHVFELPARPAGEAAPPAGGDLSWMADFKRYLWSAHQFELAMRHPATELFSIESKLKSALELVGPLEKATDDYEVHSAAHRAYTFDRIKTIEDRDRFLTAVEGFKGWVDWFRNDYGSDVLPVLLRAEIVKQYRDTYSLLNPYRTQRVTEGIGMPLLVPYEQGVTSLSDVIDHVSRVCYRMIYDKSNDNSKDEVDARILQARNVLVAECLTFVEAKRRYSTPERQYIRRPGAENLDDDEIATVLNAPLSEWLSRGARVVFQFPEDITQNYLDLQQANLVEEEEQEPRANKTRKSNEISLYDCISCFMQKEQLEETEMWYCNKCKEHRQAWKQFFLWRTPPILVIHLKRFQYDGMFREKLDQVVDFPLEGLDLTAHVLDSRIEQAAMYDLYAVSNHYGGLGGGHYTAFCRNAEDGNWYEFDDSYVRQVSASSVVTEAAYVLFYMRRDLFPAHLRSQPLVAVPATVEGTSAEEGWVHIEQPESRTDAPREDGEAPTTGGLDAPVDVLLEQGERAVADFKASGGEIPEPSSPVSSYKRSTNMYNTLYSGYL